MIRALLVIDVQYEYFTGKLPVTYPKDCFDNILKVIDASNEYDIPVILVKHTNPGKDSFTFKINSDGWKIHEEVLKRDYDYIIEKNLPGSFTGTDLESWLKDNNIDTVAICGYMTQMCCDTTARQAMHLGFNVEFLEDATGTLNVSNYAGEISAEKLHKAILVTQAMKFSKVIHIEDWIKKIDNEFTLNSVVLI
jgi:nicotinamidase-related amidase